MIIICVHTAYCKCRRPRFLFGNLTAFIMSFASRFRPVITASNPWTHAQLKMKYNARDLSQWDKGPGLFVFMTESSAP